MALGDLGDAQLWQLMEDLWQEAALRDLTMSPIGPPLDHWMAPARSVDTNLEDYEVTLWGRGWGPNELPTWPTGLPHTEEDVGHLLSTLAAGLRLRTPRINTFSGHTTPGKTEVSFEQWYHEVQCVKDHYPTVSSLGRYNQVSKRGNSGYDPIHGYYCQCSPEFEEAIGHFWHGSLL